MEASAKALQLSTKFMQSGAGHNAQEIANIAPVAMIFVPGVAGIRHSPKEFTKPAAMANGANVLLKTILAIDKIKFLLRVKIAHLQLTVKLITCRRQPL